MPHADIIVDLVLQEIDTSTHRRAPCLHIFVGGTINVVRGAVRKTCGSLVVAALLHHATQRDLQGQGLGREGDSHPLRLQGHDLVFIPQPKRDGGRLCTPDPHATNILDCAGNERKARAHSLLRLVLASHERTSRSIGAHIYACSRRKRIVSGHPINDTLQQVDVAGTECAIVSDAR